MSVSLAYESGGGGVVNCGIAYPCGNIIGFIRAAGNRVISDDVEHSRCFSFSSSFVCYS